MTEQKKVTRTTQKKTAKKGSKKKSSAQKSAKSNTVKVVKHPTATIPEYKTDGAAGCDLVANIMYPQWLEPGEFTLVDTGLQIAEIPEGYELQVRPRSGLAMRYGVTVLNTPGTIDSDYRGPLKVILVNFGREKFEVNKDMRIGQLVLSKVEQINFETITQEELDEQEETERGEGGFGSTGE